MNRKEPSYLRRAFGIVPIGIDMESSSFFIILYIIKSWFKGGRKMKTKMIGKKVSHNRFGDGIVTSNTGNIIEVDFSNQRRKFIYPDAFSRFITCSDNKIQTEIMALLNHRNQKQQLIQEFKRREQERLQRIKKLKLVDNSHAAFGLIHNDLASIQASLTIKTGDYLSGKSKGQPRIATRIAMNSACILTEVPNGKKEEERRIIGVMMLREDVEGKYCLDGNLAIHPTLRVLLSPSEQKLLFWNYQSLSSSKNKWGNTEFKYLSSDCVKQILHDMKNIITGEEERGILNNLYLYFCSLNQLTP